MEVLRTVKISFDGEVKRVKTTSDYAGLRDSIKQTFKHVPSDFKTYYLDEEFEIISVSSSDDLLEALELSEQQAKMLKLIIAESQAEAQNIISKDVIESSSAWSEIRHEEERPGLAS